MKYILLYFLIFEFHCFSQIWNDPRNCFTPILNPERSAKECKKYKSYTDCVYDANGGMVYYDQYIFNTDGHAIKHLHGRSPELLTDSSWAVYSGNTLIQEFKYHFETNYLVSIAYTYNTRKKISEVHSSENDSSWTRYFSYNNFHQLDSVYSPFSVIRFQYSDNQEVVKREVFMNNKLQSYDVFYESNKSKVHYQHCIINYHNQEPHEPCEVSEVFIKKNHVVKINDKFDLDSNNVFCSEYSYDRKGNLIEVLRKGLIDNEIKSRRKYFRNKNGQLLRIDRYKKNELVYYHVFTYEYR